MSEWTWQMFPSFISTPSDKPATQLRSADFPKINSPSKEPAAGAALHGRLLQSSFGGAFVITWTIAGKHVPVRSSWPMWDLHRAQPGWAQRRLHQATEKEFCRFFSFKNLPSKGKRFATNEKNALASVQFLLNNLQEQLYTRMEKEKYYRQPGNTPKGTLLAWQRGWI